MKYVGKLENGQIVDLPLPGARDAAVERPLPMPPHPGREEARASRRAAASKEDASVARGGAPSVSKGEGAHGDGMGLKCNKI